MEAFLAGVCLPDEGFRGRIREVSAQEVPCEEAAVEKDRLPSRLVVVVGVAAACDSFPSHWLRRTDFLRPLYYPPYSGLPSSESPDV